MTDMKKSIKITVASISALVLAMACIVAAPLLKDVLNDIVNPAYRKTSYSRMMAGPILRIPRFALTASR